MYREDLCPGAVCVCSAGAPFLVGVSEETKDDEAGGLCLCEQTTLRSCSCSQIKQWLTEMDHPTPLSCHVLDGEMQSGSVCLRR